MTASIQSQRITANLALVTACTLFGGAIAVMAIGLLATEPPSGWSGLADHLGSLTVGGLLGCISGIYVARDLSVTALWWSTGVALFLAAGTLWSLALAV